MLKRSMHFHVHCRAIHFSQGKELTYSVTITGQMYIFNVVHAHREALSILEKNKKLSYVITWVEQIIIAQNKPDTA